MRGVYFAAVFMVLGISVDARAYCSEPMAPSPPRSYAKPTKPIAPFCVNEFTRTHTCDDWQIRAYNTEIEIYRSDVEDYVRKLKWYVQEAATFADQALSYAKCEVNDLN